MIELNNDNWNNYNLIGIHSFEIIWINSFTEKHFIFTIDYFKNMNIILTAAFLCFEDNIEYCYNFWSLKDI